MRGVRGSEGSKTGVRGSEGSEMNVILGFKAPTTIAPCHSHLAPSPSSLPSLHGGGDPPVLLPLTPLTPSCSHLTPCPHRGGGDSLSCSPHSHLSPCPHRGGGDPLSHSLSLPSLPLTPILPLAPTEMVGTLLTYFDHWEQEGVRGARQE